jgi:hypothetical protein
MLYYLIATLVFLVSTAPVALLVYIGCNAADSRGERHFIKAIGIAAYIAAVALGALAERTLT